MKRILCWIKAIPLLLRCGVWAPHLYGYTTYERAIIVATDKSFRVAKDYKHEPGEKVYPDACLIKSQCVHCKHEDISWYHSWNERWKVGINIHG